MSPDSHMKKSPVPPSCPPSAILLINYQDKIQLETWEDEIQRICWLERRINDVNYSGSVGIVDAYSVDIKAELTTILKNYVYFIICCIFIS